MFDEIETSYQLHYAWKSGARFFKGKYLATPTTEYLPRDVFKEKIRSECQQFISMEKKRLEAKYEGKNKLRKKHNNNGETY